jgi:hypothetical protein
VRTVLFEYLDATKVIPVTYLAKCVASSPRYKSEGVPHVDWTGCSCASTVKLDMVGGVRDSWPRNCSQKCTGHACYRHRGVHTAQSCKRISQHSPSVAIPASEVRRSEGEAVGDLGKCTRNYHGQIQSYPNGAKKRCARCSRLAPGSM